MYVDIFIIVLYNMVKEQKEPLYDSAMSPKKID